MTNEEAILMLERIMYDEDNYGINWATGVKETFNMAISALEKQIPKKIISKDDDGYRDCPVCGKILRYRSEAYCYNCGQKYVWKVVEE